MNRIRELREALGMSAEELAEKVCETRPGTTQPTITRIETGERKLTVQWMQHFAKALNVRPIDLIAAATIADFVDETEPYVPETADLVAPLASRKLYYFRVMTDSVSLAGAKRGGIVLFDGSKGALDGLQTGDIVHLRVYPRARTTNAKADPKKGISLIRQFVAPGLYVTNRKGANTAFADTDAGIDFQISVCGVMVVSNAAKRGN